MTTEDPCRTVGSTATRLPTAKIGLPGVLRILEINPPESLRSLRAGARARLEQTNVTPSTEARSMTLLADTQAASAPTGIAGKAPCN